MGIFLHPKYGLNPTIPTCILCGKEKGEIALLGRAYKEEAPMHMVLDFEPCKDCREKYLNSGIMLVEVEDNKYKAIVIKEEAFKRIFSADIPPRRIAMVERGLLNKIGANV